jgi:hypothetical protein
MSFPVKKAFAFYFAKTKKVQQEMNKAEDNVTN